MKKDSSKDLVKHTIEVTGEGASATDSGVAAGANGVAIGGDVFGNVTKVVNLISVIGGMEQPSANILHSLGLEIQQTRQVTDPIDYTELIVSSLDTIWPKDQTESVISYLNLLGLTFSPLAASFLSEDISTASFPFGDFLQDMLRQIDRSAFFSHHVFDAFAKEVYGIEYKLRNRLFLPSTPLKYLVLPLTHTTKAFLKTSKDSWLPFPNEPLSLLCRADSQGSRLISNREIPEIAMGQLVKHEEQTCIVRIKLHSRSYSSDTETQPKNFSQQQFTTTVIGIFADFVAYTHKLECENQEIRSLLNALIKLAEKE